TLVFTSGWQKRGSRQFSQRHCSPLLLPLHEAQGLDAFPRAVFSKQSRTQSQASRNHQPPSKDYQQTGGKKQPTVGSTLLSHGRLQRRQQQTRPCTEMTSQWQESLRQT